MFTTLISLALENLLYLALHIEGISSFPKPLSAADEKKYFEFVIGDYSVCWSSANYRLCTGDIR